MYRPISVIISVLILRLLTLQRLLHTAEELIMSWLKMSILGKRATLLLYLTIIPRSVRIHHIE